MKDSIKALRELEKRLYAYQYAMAVADYDSETVAPPESSAGRAEAMEVLSRAYFDQLVSADTAALLQRAAADAETEQEKAEVRELQRSYDEIGKIPAEEYAAFTKLTQESMPAWGKAKRGNDFASFAPYLEKIVESLRAQAHYFAPDRDPYEVWLDRYEHGLTIAQCDTFFAALRETIVPLLTAIKERGSAIRTDFLYQNWPIEQQRKLSKKIMEVWGLDPDHCVLGETEHPFTSGFWHGDVRITTHYMPQDMFSNLYSVAHEGGHALYELNVDPKYDYTILAGGATTGLHESQSRLFENYVGRSRAFIHYLYPTLLELFPQQLNGVTEEEIYRAVNRAEPSLIRTEADELTYSLHIMVRYELEKALMQGTLTVAELPAAFALPEGLPASWRPLAVALGAMTALRGGRAVLPAGLEAEENVVESYLHAAGLALDAEGCLVAWKPGDDMEEAEEQDEEGRPVRKPRPALQARGWNAPDAPWAVALALAACARGKQEGFKLGNPGVLTELYPPFWVLYNNLPEPHMTRENKEVPAEPVKSRRRVITSAVAVPPLLEDDDY